MIDLHPMPPTLRLDRAAWIATPEVIRDETIRAWTEIEQGIAVAKDRWCGRPQSHRRPAAAQADSFYALHLLDMGLWRRPDDEALQAKAAALRLRLAPDAERYAAMQARDGELAEFHALAKAGGTTLPEALAKYIAVEQHLRADPIRGLETLARKYGVDLAAVLARALEAEPVPDAAA